MIFQCYRRCQSILSTIPRRCGSHKVASIHRTKCTANIIMRIFHFASSLRCRRLRSAYLLRYTTTYYAHYRWGIYYAITIKYQESVVARALDRLFAESTQHDFLGAHWDICYILYIHKCTSVVVVMASHTDSHIHYVSISTYRCSSHKPPHTQPHKVLTWDPTTTTKSAKWAPDNC